MTHLDLAARCLVHADKADDAGLYTTANVLWLAYEALKGQSPMTPAEVRAYRQSLGMTQAELADALELAGENGKRTVRHWETESGKFQITGPARVAIRLMVEIEKLRGLARGVARSAVEAEKSE